MDLDTIQNYVAGAAIAAIIVTASLPLIVYAARKLRKVGIGFAVIALGFLYCAATKPGYPMFRFDSSMRNNGSYATNDTVHIAWYRSVSVPTNTVVHIAYADQTTNAVFRPLAETTIGAYQWSTNGLSGATNFNYRIWSDWTPPTPVHTNGVWQYKTVKTTDRRNILPAGARIKADGKKVETLKKEVGK